MGNITAMKMKKFWLQFLPVLTIAPFMLLICGWIVAGKTFVPESYMASVIENFDAGTISLESYPGEDEDPLDWEINSDITYQNSPYSLKLFGNTWKLQNISAIAVDTGDIWQVSAYIASKAEIQGFGIMDAENALFYSFAGSQEVSTENWVPVYQGSFPEDQWNIYRLPVADDWLAWFGYLPEITALVYINDRDATSQGVVYFDNIINITEDLPVAPEVTIDYVIGAVYKSKGSISSVDVQFNAVVVDPDSDEFDFFWNFGDGVTSEEQNPQHTFLISDDHPYTVLLRVSDPSNMWGWASCSIEVGPGSSSWPVTMNFVGDIMLARDYEYPGGIIPTQGVEAIFAPTRQFLGDAADITVANLECSLTTYWQHHPTKPIYYKGSPENVQGLKYAGIDIVTLANNHIMDYLQPGMQETQSVLQENNIVFSGSGINSYQANLPAFYSKSGVNFAFLAASDRTGQYGNYQPYLDAGYNKPGFANLTEYSVKKQIDEVKQVSDLVVVEWHSGSEYSFTPDRTNTKIQPFAEDCKKEEDYSPLNYFPSKSDIEIRHFAINNGADLVICHHPHIIQSVELYNGKLIAHSLGNFVFDLDYPETFPSMILNAKINETGFYEFSITPVYIDDYIPQRAKGGLGLHILDYLAKGSKDLSTWLRVDRDSVIATVIMDTANMTIFETEFSETLSLSAVNNAWETAPCPIENAGSISSIKKIQPAGIYEYRLGKDEIWFGNMENEGCTLWNLNSNDETYCDTAAFAGIRSIQQRREAGAASNIVTNFEERIICRSDTLDYSLCGYIKTSNSAGVTIEIQYYEDRESVIPLGSQNIGVLVYGDTPWTFYHHELTIPAGTEFFDVRLNTNKPTSGTALSWFDNVSLICWNNWDDCDNSKKIPAPNDYYFFQVKTTQFSDEIVVNYTTAGFDELPVGVDNPANVSGSDFNLIQCFPNPFNTEAGPTKITFNFDKTEKVKLSIFAMNGQKVTVLADGDFNPGAHHLFWDGTNSQGQPMLPGIYFLEMEIQNKKHIKKCVLLRF